MFSCLTCQTSEVEGNKAVCRFDSGVSFVSPLALCFRYLFWQNVSLDVSSYSEKINAHYICQKKILSKTSCLSSQSDLIFFPKLQIPIVHCQPLDHVYGAVPCFSSALSYSTSQSFSWLNSASYKLPQLRQCQCMMLS